MNKVVLAYSGGLDTSIILKWLKEEKDLDVIAYAADLGQAEELDSIEEKALKTGASKVYVEDLKEEFVTDFIFPMMQANAVYESVYLMGTSIARPLIAKRQIEIAEKEGANYVAHGATGKGNDQVRFELTFYALKPDIKVIAPWRDWSFQGREDLINYAKKHDIEIPVTLEKPYSSDRNIMHISFEGGILEDPWAEPPEDMFLLSVSPEKAPDKAQYVEIEFSKGLPIAINGKNMEPVELLETLNRIGGEHGIGRVDLVENRFVGMKSRGVYETPGMTILYAAHRAVESLTLDREVMHFKDELIPKYAQAVYYGFWYSPEMKILNNTIKDTQEKVDGIARLKLYKGNCIVVGRKSPVSLYDPKTASFDEAGGYNQKDAEGFIKLNALRLRLQKLQKKK